MRLDGSRIWKEKDADSNISVRKIAKFVKSASGPWLVKLALQWKGKKCKLHNELAKNREVSEKL